MSEMRNVFFYNTVLHIFNVIKNYSYKNELYAASFSGDKLQL